MTDIIKVRSEKKDKFGCRPRPIATIKDLDAHKEEVGLALDMK